MNETCTTPINLVGLVVNSTPKAQLAVHSALKLMTGTEIHHAKEGKFVVTIEQIDQETRLADLITDINNLPGVITTSIAYHHFDGDLANQEQPL